MGEWTVLGRRDGGKEKGRPVGSHVCAAFMKGKGIAGGIAAELTDCMKNRLVGKEHHRAGRSHRHSQREEKKPRETKGEGAAEL